MVMDTISPLAAGARPLTAELLRAKECYAARRWAEATAICQQYVYRDPGQAFAWHRLGKIQIQLGQCPAAIGGLEQTIRIGGAVPADFRNLVCADAMGRQHGPSARQRRTRHSGRAHSPATV